MAGPGFHLLALLSMRRWRTIIRSTISPSVPSHSDGIFTPLGKLIPKISSDHGTTIKDMHSSAVTNFQLIFFQLIFMHFPILQPGGIASAWRIVPDVRGKRKPAGRGLWR